MRLIIITACILLSSCNKQSENIDEKTVQMSNHELISHIKLAINPKFQDWVLFKNGTYIIFDEANTIKDVNSEALKQMKDFGPVYAGGSAGDFGIIKLNQTDGWLVSGHGYGMYTYVNPGELRTKNPSDSEIGFFGRNKRDLDSKRLEIIYVNRKK
ncbi:hypothetical protein [Epilithonimonas sp. JDS]|uniref:hypothetical protein n=1 Tax=Epilithonimonas sp. JDS TaxID=2902797 RepID=UPI001E5C555C|nr:hypothetical protein [Epilithonimonas sp. JDS]